MPLSENVLIKIPNNWGGFLSPLSLGLVILFTIVLIIGFIQTIRVGQTQNGQNGSEIDSEISGVVKAHPYARNPVFWAYIIGLGIVFAYMFYHFL